MAAKDTRLTSARAGIVRNIPETAENGERLASTLPDDHPQVVAARASEADPERAISRVWAAPTPTVAPELPDDHPQVVAARASEAASTTTRSRATLRSAPSEE